MRIGLFGWINQGAFADDLLTDTIKEMLINASKDIGESTAVFTGPWLRGDELIDQLRTMDCLIFGGGSLLAPLKMHPLSSVREWLPIVNKPLHLFGTGFRKECDLLDEQQRALNGYLIHELASYWPRGHFTVQELSRNNIHRKPDGVGDPGICACPVPKVRTKKHCLGLVVRDLPPEEIQHSDNRTTHKLFALVARHWVNKIRRPLRFISWRHNTPGYDNDAEAAQKVIGIAGLDLNDYEVIEAGHWEDAYRATIECSDVFSQRLHPFISAVTYTRAVGCEYQFGKTIDAADALGLVEYIDMRGRLTEDKLRALSAKVFCTLERAHTRYSQIQSSVVKARAEMYEHLQKRIFQ